MELRRLPIGPGLGLLAANRSWSGPSPPGQPGSLRILDQNAGLFRLNATGSALFLVEEREHAPAYFGLRIWPDSPE
jgi:hypothetical protein